VRNFERLAAAVLESTVVNAGELQAVVEKPKWMHLMEEISIIRLTLFASSFMAMKNSLILFPDNAN